MPSALPGLSEQAANAALAWLSDNPQECEEDLDDEILAFERSLNADWEVGLLQETPAQTQISLPAVLNIVAG